METLQVIVLVAAVSISWGFPVLLNGGDNGLGHHYEKHEKPKPYKFEYSVHDPKTKDEKEAHESSDGHTVKGYYKMKEADGTIRIVHYTADKHNGFQAHVEKIGHAEHPHKYESYPAHIPVHVPIHVPEHVTGHFPEEHHDTDSDVVVHYDPEVIHHFSAEVIHHDDDDEESDDHHYEPSEVHEVKAAESKEESSPKQETTESDHQVEPSVVHEVTVTESKQEPAIQEDSTVEDNKYEPSETHEITAAEPKLESSLKHDFSVQHDKHDSTSYQSVTFEKNA